MRVAAVIPARGGSKRLPRKNVHPVFGKPMIVWAIEACRRSVHIDSIYVSTDDEAIARLSRENGARVIMRAPGLAADEVPKMEVIRDADRWLSENGAGGAPEVYVSVQANSPELKTRDIDRGIELLHTAGLWEVISVGEDDVQNAAFRVIDRSCLYNTFLSANIGIVKNDCIDVHTIADVEKLEARYGSAREFEQSLASASSGIHETVNKGKQCL